MKRGQNGGAEGDRTLDLRIANATTRCRINSLHRFGGPQKAYFGHVGAQMSHGSYKNKESPMPYPEYPSKHDPSEPPNANRFLGWLIGLGFVVLVIVVILGHYGSQLATVPVTGPEAVEKAVSDEVKRE